jgi:hypothetical protein
MGAKGDWRLMFLSRDRINAIEAGGVQQWLRPT